MHAQGAWHSCGGRENQPRSGSRLSTTAPHTQPEAHAADVSNSSCVSLGNLNSDLVSRADIESFKELWAEFDPKATNTIAIGDLPKLIRQLEPPMGLKGAPMRWAVRMCLNLGLEHTGGKIAFEEVLNALVSHNYHTQMDDAPPPGADDFEFGGVRVCWRVYVV